MTSGCWRVNLIDKIDFDSANAKVIYCSKILREIMIIPLQYVFNNVKLNELKTLFKSSNFPIQNF